MRKIEGEMENLSQQQNLNECRSSAIKMSSEKKKFFFLIFAWIYFCKLSEPQGYLPQLIYAKLPKISKIHKNLSP